MAMKLASMLLALLLSACQSPPGSIADRAPADRLRSSWAENYRSLAALTHGADLIVVGEIGRPLATITEGAPIATEFELKIDRLIKDHRQRGALDALVLRQTGGATFTRRVEMVGDPLVQKNQRVILFLREFDTGKVYVIGGPNGRFHIEQGRVVPADKHSIAFDPSLTESEFIAQIARIVMQQDKGEAGL